MKTRRVFLDWLSAQRGEVATDLDQGLFYAFQSRDYVLGSLAALCVQHQELAPVLTDFARLEEQRYAICDQYQARPAQVVAQITQGQAYCALPAARQRQCRYRVAPNLRPLLAESHNSWDDLSGLMPLAGPCQYLIIPSYLALAPQELCLTGLHALLLDLIDLETPFHYEELAAQVGEALEMEGEALHRLLLDFLAQQVLYYRSLHPII